MKHSQCPYCGLLKPKKSFTREHLPAKALYSFGKHQIRNRPAIIYVCNDCNGKKSSWDKEILALYGDVIRYPTYEQSINSLKNPKSVENLDEMILISSRFSTQTGIQVGYAGNIRIDVVSQWMSYVAKGIYFLFMGKTFTGLVDPCKDVLPFAIKDRDNFFKDQRKITEECYVGIVRRDDILPPLVSVYLLKADGIGWNIFSAYMYENDDQIKAIKNFKPNLDGQEVNLKPTKPNCIYEIKNDRNILSYDGIVKQQ